MSEPYRSIPPERRTAYLQNAQEAIESATAPVVSPAVETLEGLVVKEAEALAADDATGNQIADEARRFLEDHEQHIQDHVEELTDEDPKQQTYSIAQQIANQASTYDFMARSREYLPPDALDRTGSNDKDFVGRRKVMGHMGIQDQLWAEMADQNRHDQDQP